ncbi:MAG: ATP-binding protein [Halobacteriales archaeon]
MSDDDIADLLEAARERADPSLEPTLAALAAEAEALQAENEQLRADKADLLEELQETSRGTLELTAELEERYHRLFESAVEGIYRATPDADRYALANPAMADILGYDDGEALCRAVTSIESDVFVDTDRYAAYRDALQSTGQLDDFEYRVRRADGAIRWVSDSATVLRDDAGAVEGFRGGVIDITDRKERERRLREQRDMLGVLNQLVRHDIRNDMNVVVGWGEELEGHVPPEKASALERLLESSQHVIELTRTAGEIVEALAADETPSLEPVDLARVLRTEVEALRAAHPEVSFALPDDLPQPRVRANELLSSVVGNLLHNAVRHNDQPDPRVAVSVEERPDTVVVRVADNGPGIPDRRKAAVFEKDQRRPDSSGTGLGLYLVDVLIDQYDGDVWIEDNEPSGAVFAVELPKATAR